MMGAMSSAPVSQMCFHTNTNNSSSNSNRRDCCAGSHSAQEVEVQTEGLWSPWCQQTHSSSNSNSKLQCHQQQGKLVAFC